MSVDAEISYDPIVVADDKLPEVGSSVVACKNASTDDTVVFTKDNLNCPDDKIQKEHNTASGITGTGETNLTCSEKNNDDEILSRENAEAAKEDESNGDVKLQFDHIENTEYAGSNGQEAPLVVTKIKGVDEIIAESNGDVKLQCDNTEKTDFAGSNGQVALLVVTNFKGVNEIGAESNSDVKFECDNTENTDFAGSSQETPPVVTKIKSVNEIVAESNGDVKSLFVERSGAEKIESNGQKAAVAEIKSVEENKGECNDSGKTDKSVDAEKVDINSSMATNTVTKTTVLEEMRNGSEETAGDDKEDNNCQRAPHLAMDLTRVEQTGCLSSCIQKSSEDKSHSDHRENAEKEDSNVQEAPDMVPKVEGINEIAGDSNGDVKLVCEESAESEEVVSNSQKAPSTVPDTTNFEEFIPESNGSTKTDEIVDSDKASSNHSMATNTSTEINGIEGESNGTTEKVSIVTEFTGIEVESKLVYQESTFTETVDNEGQRPNVVGEIKGVDGVESESGDTDKVTGVNSTREERKEAEAANSSSPVHKGDEITSESGGDKHIDDTAMRQRDGDFERLLADDLGGEGDMSSNEAIARENKTCDSCLTHGQSPADKVQEIIGTAAAGESSGMEQSTDDKLMNEEIENDKTFNCSSPAAEGMSCNTEFSEGLSISADTKLSELDNDCASNTKDVSSNKGVGSKSEALNSCTDDYQMGTTLLREGSGVEKLESESIDANNSINNKALNEKCDDPGKSHNNGSDDVGVHGDAEYSVGQSGLDDVNLCKADNSSSSSIKLVPDMATKFTSIKKEEGESIVADQTDDGKFMRENEDAENSPCINICDERVSCDAEICHDQATLAGLELSETGNTSLSIFKDVSSNEAVTLGDEAVTDPSEIDQESANTSLESTGTEESAKLACEQSGDAEISNPGEAVTLGDDAVTNPSEIIQESANTSLEITGTEESAKLACEQSGDAEISNPSKVLTPFPELRDMSGGSAMKGFHFLVRMPRFDDEKLRQRIRVAEQNVDDKTQHRDAFRQKIRNKRGNCQTHGGEFEAAKALERDARKQVRAKRVDISALQDVIDKAKNAVAIEEIDTRIRNMEHMIAHETQPLKEEKLLIREIKQLKQLRGQLSSNSGNQDDVQKALDARDANEEQLKILKKELDNLKLEVSKAEAVAMAASRKYEDESRKLKELQEQFKAADDIRQEAYEELRNLKKGFYEKNIHFRTYKDEATLASEYAQKRDMEALNSLCMNQVERHMELWNKNDEFRKEYIRCNTRSTVRRFRTLDGRSLGLDEMPAALPSYAEGRVDRPGRAEKDKLMSQTPFSQQEKQAVVVKDQIKDAKIIVQAAERIGKIDKTKEAQEQIENDRSTVEEPKEAEHQLITTKELEACGKEEELRKLEEETRLKEQRRLEEIAKAKEALERKKRNAEKAQLRAELRAQKEEEQRLKEREKRMRKKERKKGGDAQSDNNDGETALISNSPRETFKEPEATENPQTTTKKPQKLASYTKQIKTKSSTIPPPLRNRSRRKLQQWLWVFASCVVVIALFFLGNIGFFANLKPLRNPGF